MRRVLFIFVDISPKCRFSFRKGVRKKTVCGRLEVTESDLFLI